MMWWPTNRKSLGVSGSRKQNRSTSMYACKVVHGLVDIVCIALCQADLLVRWPCEQALQTLTSGVRRSQQNHGLLPTVENVIARSSRGVFAAATSIGHPRFSCSTSTLRIAGLIMQHIKGLRRFKICSIV
jgi:hypothetical protein